MADFFKHKYIKIFLVICNPVCSKMQFLTYRETCKVIYHVYLNSIDLFIIFIIHLESPSWLSSISIKIICCNITWNIVMFIRFFSSMSTVFTQHFSVYLFVVTVSQLLQSYSCSPIRYCCFSSLILKFVANQCLQLDVDNGMTTILLHQFCHVPYASYSRKVRLRRI